MVGRARLPSQPCSHPWPGAAPGSHNRSLGASPTFRGSSPTGQAPSSPTGCQELSVYSEQAKARRVPTPASLRCDSQLLSERSSVQPTALPPCLTHFQPTRCQQVQRASDPAAGAGGRQPAEQASAAPLKRRSDAAACPRGSREGGRSSSRSLGGITRQLVGV